MCIVSEKDRKVCLYRICCELIVNTAIVWGYEMYTKNNILIQKWNSFCKCRYRYGIKMLMMKTGTFYEYISKKKLTFSETNV